MKDKRILYTMALAVCYLIFFALGIKLFREPDLWWQLRTGEWIIANGQVPHVDTFSFTANGTPWVNIKWGFEVMAALFTKLAGVENLYLIQACVNLLVLFFLLKISRLLNTFQSFVQQSIAIIFAVLLVVLSSEYRMIGRPEMFSHLFTIVFIYILEKWRHTPASKIIYALIPLQCLWANMHEAFGTGIVILAIYVAGILLQKKFFTTLILSRDICKLCGILFLSIAAIIINPNGIKLLASPFEIFSQVQQNKYTTELSSLSELSSWTKEIYIVGIAILLLLVLLIRKIILKKKTSTVDLFAHFGVSYLLTIAAFCFLAYTAFRNLAFLSFILFPVWVYFFQLVIQQIMLRKKTLLLPAYYVALFTGLAMYVAVVSNQYYKITNSRDSFGLGIPCNMHPQGVAQHIEQKGLQNKKCFSDYLTSSYLMWRLQPNFKTYIDLRDLDVFTSDFFNDYLRTVNDYKYFLNIDRIQHFDYVVLQRTQHDVLHAYLYNDSIYACTYVDQVAAVYEKTDAFSRADIFNYCTDVKQNALSKFINLALNPLYSSNTFQNSNSELIAAQYYINVGRIDLAEQRIQKALVKYPDEKDKTQCALGNLFARRAIFIADPKQKSDFLMQAAGAYNTALQFNNKNFEAMVGLGTSQFYLQNYNDALQTFGKAIELKSDDANAISNAIECSRAIADKFPDRKIEMQNLELKYCKMAYNNESQNPVNIMNLGFALYKTGDSTAAKKYLSSIQNNEMLSEDNRRDVNRLLGY
nr:hypothetical protein [Bacteroidota bacterium]